jgi:DNA-binding CsgD family transcriptional regulator
VFTDWVKPGAGYDIFWGMGACLRMGAGQVGFMASHHSRRQGPMTERDRMIFQRLLPHVRRVLHMRGLASALNERLQSLEALCDRAPCALALIDRRARLAYANRDAETLLKSGVGLRLRGDGTVEAGSAAETVALHAAAAAACSTGLAGQEEAGARLRVARADGRPPLLVSVCPVPTARNPGGRTHALVFIEDVAAPAVPAVDKIRLAFALTEAEARLAQRIAGGEPLRTAADAESITYETARTRLKSIFHKTGATRQAQLALLMANIADAAP